MSKLIEARFRRRAEVGESLPQVHRELLGRLARVEGIWRSDPAEAYFELGQGESAAADLSDHLRAGICGSVSYASRLSGSVVDKAISDDVLVLEIDTGVIDLDDFCESGFLQVVSALGAYRASVVTDSEQDLDDFEEIVNLARATGRDIDGRDSVFRLHRLQFLDKELCRRAFNLSPLQIMHRLEGSEAMGTLSLDGVLIKISEPNRESLSATGGRILDKLRQKSAVER